MSEQIRKELAEKEKEWQAQHAEPNFQRFIRTAQVEHELKRREAIAEFAELRGILSVFCCSSISPFDLETRGFLETKLKLLDKMINVNIGRDE